MPPRRKAACLILSIFILVTGASCVTITGVFQAFQDSQDLMFYETQDDLQGSDPAQDPSQESTFEGEGAYGTPDSDGTGGYEEEYDEEERPVLSGSEELLDTQHFRIHYTFTGEDAVPSSEFVQTIAEALEYVWQMEIEQFGWAAPPTDGQIGGNSLFDVYLLEILWDGTFGYVENSMEPHTHGVRGDNPNTDTIEKRAAVSFMALDNDYANTEDLDLEGYDPLDLMRSTVAHEFNHTIQFGYDGEEPADWLWEATATWMQDEVYDDVNDGVEDLYAVFKSPDTCQLAVGGTERVEDDGHWYGEWIYIRYLSEHFGANLIRSIWEQAVPHNGYDAIEAALQTVGTSLEETLRGFSVALLTRDFEEGSTFPVLRLEGTAKTGQTFIPVDGVGQIAADYVEILADGIVSVSLQSSDLEPLLVGIENGTASLFQAAGSQVTVDADRYQYLYLIVLNPNKATSEYHCSFSDYSVYVQQGGQPQAPAATLPAPNFSKPDVEPLMDPDEIWGEGWEKDYPGSEFPPINAPAELVPSYVPDGYELYEAYTMQAEDFGEDAIWFAPGGGEVSVVDFYGPGDEDYLSTSAAYNPYSTYDEFFADADWEPYEDEWYTLRGIAVIIEDYTDENGPYSFATCFRGSQFIVVEGNLTPDEMARVVESMLD
ncbi:MAG: hypothetical protein JXA25_08905 [Anaerolineales bacterium]|nr:hypothetical protein [Anaerolineales bacterium]